MQRAQWSMKSLDLQSDFLFSAVHYLRTKSVGKVLQWQPIRIQRHQECHTGANHWFIQASLLQWQHEMVIGDHIYMMWSQFIMMDVFNISYKNFLMDSHITLMYQIIIFTTSWIFFSSSPSLCYKLHKCNVQYVKRKVTLPFFYQQTSRYF